MNRRLSKIWIAAALVGPAIAQVAPPADLQRADGPSLDGATHRAVSGAHQAAPRIAPHIVVDAVELPATRPSDPAMRGTNDAGYIEAIDPAHAQPSGWSQLEDGSRVAAIEFRSAEAVALRLRLSGAWPSSGLDLRVYDPATGSSFGPYRNPIRDQNGNWWTTIIFGESIGLEWRISAESEVPARLPEVTAVAYHNVAPGPGPRGCTHNDIACFDEWQDTHGRAVCVMATVNGDDTLATFCTGSLLNRTPNDGSPLIATANHCVGSQSAAHAATFVWGWERASCGGSLPTLNDLPRSNGSLLLKSAPEADWNLLGSYEPPGENFHLGWSTGNWLIDTPATGIHHPGGSNKRISFGDAGAAAYREFCGTDGACFNAHVWNVNWSSGWTQPGSSGSPVMDEDRRVRGVLTGGPDDDCTLSRYGRFGVAFDTLEPYIHTVASPVWVEAGFNGTGWGTSGSPFNQVHEATYAVIEGDEVRIRAGTYGDRCTIWRPMTLNANGGLVRIGL